MKYIKYYENLDSKKEKLNDICFEYLAFLYDEGFSTKITKINGSSSNDFEVSIVKYKKYSDVNNFIKDRFSWIDVKDDIIAFYEILKEKYTLIDYFNGKANCAAYIEIYTSTQELYISEYELENIDNIKLNENILSITFKVSV